MGIIFIALAGVVIVMLIMVSAFNREKIFKAAEESYYEGRSGEAIIKLKSYLDKKHDDIKARALLAKIYLEEKENVLALKENLVINMHKNATINQKSQAYTSIAQIYFEDENYSKVIKTCTEGLKFNIKNVSLYYYLGKTYMKLAREKQALKILSEGLKYNPNHIDSRVALGNLYMTLKDVVKARQHYRKVLIQDDENVEARYNLAMIYYNEGNLKSAAQNIEKIKDFEGREYYCHEILMRYYMQEKEYALGLPVLLKMYGSRDVFKSLWYEILYNLGVIYENQEDYEDAYKYLTELKEENPRYKDVEEKIFKLTQILYPDEYENLVHDIDYSEINDDQLQDIFTTMVDRLGLGFSYQVEHTGKGIVAVCTDKFDASMTRYLVQLTRVQEVSARMLQVFLDRFEDQQVKKGIFITTGDYTEQAISFGESYPELELLDKVHIHGIIGDID